MTSDIYIYRMNLKQESIDLRVLEYGSCICDICRWRRGIEMHEWISRKSTIKHPEARLASFQPPICSLLCRQCHQTIATTKEGKHILLEGIYSFMANKKSVKQPQPSPLPSGVASFPNSSPFAGMEGLFDLEGISFVTEYRPFKGIYTGSLALDWACGNGRGIPRGEITQICGVPGSGKSSLGLIIVATAVYNGQKVAVASMERRWNVEYAAKSNAGLPGQDYLLADPKTQEDCLNFMVWCAEHDFDVFILDSVAAMSPRQEMEGDLEDSAYALQARVFSQFFRMRMDTISRSKMAIVMINQLRVSMDSYAPISRPGGKALAYFTSVGIDLQKPPADDFDYGDVKNDPIAAKNHKDKVNPLGFTIKGKTYKNSVAPPFRPVEVAIRFDDGLSVDTAEEVIEFGKQFKVITGKDGGAPGHYYFNGEKLGESKLMAKQFLYDNPDIMAEVTRTIREQMMGA